MLCSLNDFDYSTFMSHTEAPVSSRNFIETRALGVIIDLYNFVECCGKIKIFRYLFTTQLITLHFLLKNDITFLISDRKHGSYLEIQTLVTLETN